MLEGSSGSHPKQECAMQPQWARVIMQIQEGIDRGCSSLLHYYYSNLANQTAWKVWGLLVVFSRHFGPSCCFSCWCCSPLLYFWAIFLRVRIWSRECVQNIKDNQRNPKMWQLASILCNANLGMMNFCSELSERMQSKKGRKLWLSTSYVCTSDEG